MTEEHRPGIAPPPSVDDVLSALAADSRIGQVDFTATLEPEPVAVPKLAPEPEPEPVPEPVTEPVTVAEPEPVVEKPKKVRAPKRPRPVAVAEPEPEPEPEPAVVVALSLETPTFPGDVARLVEEVAESVIARMRAAEEAVIRHVEAMEVEATRRYELVTAQAELDAELIRLQSRREAHAIVSAARMRAGELDDVEDDHADHGYRLSVLSDAVGRVADSTESTLVAARERARAGEGRA